MMTAALSKRVQEMNGRQSKNYPYLYTIVASWRNDVPEVGGSVEEIDIRVTKDGELGRIDAIACAALMLAVDYDDGWDIVQVLGPRVGQFI